MHPLSNQPCVKHSTQSSPFMCPTTLISQTGKLRLRNLVILLLRHRGGISDSIFLTGAGDRGVFEHSPPLIFLPPDHTVKELLRVLDCHALQPSPHVEIPPQQLLRDRGSGKGQTFLKHFPVAPIQTLPSWPPNILFQLKKKKTKRAYNM